MVFPGGSLVQYYRHSFQLPVSLFSGHELLTLISRLESYSLCIHSIVSYWQYACHPGFLSCLGQLPLVTSRADIDLT